MKTSRSLSLLALAVTFATACAAPTAPTEDEAPAPDTQPELSSNVAPKDVPAPWPGPWGDGDTMGDSFGTKKAGHPSQCLTGKEKMDCLRRCSASHRSDPDICVSTCTGC